MLDADADRADLELRLIKLMLKDRARGLRFLATAAHGAERTNPIRLMLADMGQQADAYVLRQKLSWARSAVPLACYAPDHIANIVRNQNGAVETE